MGRDSGSRWLEKDDSKLKAEEDSTRFLGALKIHGAGGNWRGTIKSSTDCS